MPNEDKGIDMNAIEPRERSIITDMVLNKGITPGASIDYLGPLGKWAGVGKYSQIKPADEYGPLDKWWASRFGVDPKTSALKDEQDFLIKAGQAVLAKKLEQDTILSILPKTRSEVNAMSPGVAQSIAPVDRIDLSHLSGPGAGIVRETMGSSMLGSAPFIDTETKQPSYDRALTTPERIQAGDLLKAKASGQMIDTEQGLVPTGLMSSPTAEMQALEDRRAAQAELNRGGPLTPERRADLRIQAGLQDKGPADPMGRKVLQNVPVGADKDGNPIHATLIQQDDGSYAPLQVGGKSAQGPSKPLVTIQNKMETEQGKTIGKAFGDQYVDLQKSGASASSRLSKLTRMETLLSGVQTGKLTPAMTEVQAIGASLGFPVDEKLGAKQALVALANEIALELRNPSGGAGMPGALSDQDRAFLTSMTPGLANTTEGNRLLIETKRKLLERDQVVSHMARDYYRKRGRFDEGFYAELQRYSDKHPLFETTTTASEQAGGWSIKQIKEK